MAAKERTNAEYKAWKEGYELGMKNTLKQNSAAIEIGTAILAVLDKRYEQQEEDY